MWLTGKCITRFIEADNSRAPLNCTASMLKCILTYEQVPPSFLKAVYAFGDQEGEPNDAGLAGFGFDSGYFRKYYCDSGGSAYDENNLWYLVRSVERAEVSETRQSSPGEPGRWLSTIRSTPRPAVLFS